MGDTRRISKTGKSKKLGKIKKKKQVVAADLSSDRGEESRGDDAEVEVNQMSSGDEDFSKGTKNETLEISRGKKKGKRSRDEKRKKGESTRTETQEFDTQSEQTEDKLQKSKKKKRQNVEKINKVDGVSEKDDAQSDQGEAMLQKSKKKKRKNAEINKVDEVNGKDDAQSNQAENKLQQSKKKKRKNVEKINKVDGVNEKDDASEQQIGKSKKPGKMKKKQLVATDISSDNLLGKKEEGKLEDAEDEVYEMSSGDEDYSKGMKKWIMEYHQSRPGLKVLQERIDDFIMAHEAKEEQAKAEKEAQAAEGGWTVVVHHKGRKKTTDAESGVAVGSVAQAAVLDNMGKKKKKEVGLDFYRFQKKEAHRNEIMMLQSKFEQDKKRIQQMRAARKFRPY